MSSLADIAYLITAMSNVPDYISHQRHMRRQVHIKLSQPRVDLALVNALLRSCLSAITSEASFAFASLCLDLGFSETPPILIAQCEPLEPLAAPLKATLDRFPVSPRLALAVFINEFPEPGILELLSAKIHLWMPKMKQCLCQRVAVV